MSIFEIVILDLPEAFREVFCAIDGEIEVKKGATIVNK